MEAEATPRKKKKKKKSQPHTVVTVPPTGLTGIYMVLLAMTLSKKPEREGVCVHTAMGQAQNSILSK